MLRLSLTLALTVLLSASFSPAALADDEHGVHPFSAGLVYGDDEGRFTLPLVGDWKALERQDGQARFRLEEPTVDLHIVSDVDADSVDHTDAALSRIGFDPSSLVLVQETDEAAQLPGWHVRLYGLEDGRILGALTRDVGGGPVTIIGIGELAGLFSAETILSVGRMRDVSVSEYEAGAAAAITEPPGSLSDIEDFDDIAFAAGDTALTGSLALPDGEGPFPAIVLTHGSGRAHRMIDSERRGSPLARALVDAGFAVFSYDKRGIGESGGAFVEVGIETGAWRLRQLAADALAAVEFVSGIDCIDRDRIGLIGGSQAGWVNALAAAASADLAFVVSVTGPTVSVGLEGHYSDLAGDQDRLAPMTASHRDALRDQLAGYEGPVGFDPRPAISATQTPSLWVFGEEDASVPTPESRAVLEELVDSGHTNLAFLAYPGEGHAIDPAVYLGEMLRWIEATDVAADAERS